jgi:D-3-phosphoglycerate dehydrogenase
MDENLDSLVLDLLEWVGQGARPYDEVMDAWRTSCPRLPVWEEAGDRGYLDRRFIPGEGRFVTVTAAGNVYLRRHRMPVAHRS